MLKTHERYVLNYVLHAHAEGRRPTPQEISDAVSLGSSGTASRILNVLVKKGYLADDSESGVANGVVHGAIDHLSLPFAGLVGGASFVELAHVTETIDLAARFDEPDLVAVRVGDDDLRGAGIFNGDVVVVRRQSVVRDGQIALVLIDQQVSVLRQFVYHGDREAVELRGIRDAATPQFYHPRQIEIQGVLYAQMRWYVP